MLFQEHPTLFPNYSLPSLPGAGLSFPGFPPQSLPRALPPATCWLRARLLALLRLQTGGKAQPLTCCELPPHADSASLLVRKRTGPDLRDLLPIIHFQPTAAPETPMHGTELTWGILSVARPSTAQERAPQPQVPKPESWGQLWLLHLYPPLLSTYRLHHSQSRTPSPLFPNVFLRALSSSSSLSEQCDGCCHSLMTALQCLTYARDEIQVL